MKIKFIAILCFLALTIPAHAEHIRNDGMGGFYTDNGHVRSDGFGGYYTNDDHVINFQLKQRVILLFINITEFYLQAVTILTM